MGFESAVLPFERLKKAHGRGPFAVAWVEMLLIESAVLPLERLGKKAHGRGPFAIAWVEMLLIKSAVLPLERLGKKPMVKGPICSCMSGDALESHLTWQLWMGWILRPTSAGCRRRGVVANTKHHPKQAYHNLVGWAVLWLRGSSSALQRWGWPYLRRGGMVGCWLLLGRPWTHPHYSWGACNKQKETIQSGTAGGPHGTCQPEVRPAHTGMYRIVTFGSTDMAIHTNSHPCRVPEIQLAKRGSCKVEKGTQK